MGVASWWPPPAGAVLLVLLTGGSLVATLLTSDTNLVYNGTHTRAAELLIGALVALARGADVDRARALAVAASSIGLVGAWCAGDGRPICVRSGCIAVASSWWR